MKSGNKEFVDLSDNKEQNSVLIIDDEVDILNLLALHLRLKNYIVYQASNGKEGIELAISEKPDIIIIDVMMPDMSGFEVCKKLKESIETANIPIIFLTARSTIDDKINGLGCGADDYIVKPFDFDELEMRIKRSLKGFQNSKFSKIKVYAGKSLEEKINKWFFEKTNINMLLIRLLTDADNDNQDNKFLKELHDDFLIQLNLILLDKNEKCYFLGRLDNYTYLFFNLFNDLEIFCRNLIESIKKSSNPSIKLKISIYLNIEKKYKEAKDILTEVGATGNSIINF
ncbi:MAG: response regulator [Caldisericia bacterium]|nr:response regulator [Caldisericia bacterium]MDD5689400.1 response regulator [Caldisericia bacterium]HOJ16405.1 response regulator [Caldisericia bacterium]HOW02922.1 response regulator [Caldisericia bacterium]HPO29064.1 response regulator [Caldisericia bacterium]